MAERLQVVLEFAGAAHMSEQVRYSMLIEWSDEDHAYLVTLPEWAGWVNTPTTHGATYEDAVRHGHEVLDDLIAIHRERGELLPEPQVHASASM
jgi:antitoxin HicB